MIIASHQLEISIKKNELVSVSVDMKLFEPKKKKK